MAADPNSPMAGAHVALQVKHAELGSLIARTSHPGQTHQPAELAEGVIEMRDACNEWIRRLADWIESKKEGT